MNTTKPREEWEKEFDEKFVRHPAEIKGMKRIEWKQLCEDRIEEIKFFIRSLRLSDRKALREEIEKKKIHVEIDFKEELTDEEIGYNQALVDISSSPLLEITEEK